MLLNCTNSLTGKGILIDCENNEFELPYRYFRNIFQFKQSESKEEGKVNESFDSTYI